MTASTGLHLASRVRKLKREAGDPAAGAPAAQPRRGPGGTAGLPEASTSRRIDSSSSPVNSRMGVGPLLTVSTLPKVDLQRFAVAPRRDVHEGLAVAPVVGNATIQQIINFLHVVTGLLRAGGTQICGVRENAHARHDGIPGK